MVRPVFWTHVGRFLCALSLFICISKLLQAQPGNFATTGDLRQARSSHSATLLANGRVLVAGGIGAAGQAVRSAEVFNASNGSWTRVADMKVARAGHTATLLIGGRVLVVGGHSLQDPLAQAEIYDRNKDTWTSVNSLAFARTLHSATRLLDGKVLVAGGIGDTGTGAIREVEIYHPSTGKWETRTPLGEARENHFATLLSNGQVLVAGGNSEIYFGQFLRRASSELYNPALDQWTPAGDMSASRVAFQGLRLPDGRVLVAGGGTASSEVFDPYRDGWTGSSDMQEARSGFSMTMLEDGRVLAAGGSRSAVELASADLLNPTSGFWNATAAMQVERADHTSTRLLDGRVLIAGGKMEGTAIRSAELYTAGSEIPTPRILYAQAVLGAGFTSVLLASNMSAVSWSGRVILNGGNWSPTIPWTVDTQDRTGETEIPLILGPAETVSLLLTSNQGPYSGWLEIVGDSGSNASSIASSFFYRYEPGGRLVAATGLVPATAARTVRFPVQKGAFVSTGMALREGRNFSISLFDSQGNFIDSVTRFDGGAFFFDELFDEIPGEFLGSVEVSAGVGFFITVLRQDFDWSEPGRFQITSVPATPASESLP